MFPKTPDVSVRRRVLNHTVVKTKARDAKAPLAVIETAVVEALHMVRTERFAVLRLRRS